MEDALKTKLAELGLTEEQVGALGTEGATTEADIALLSADDIKTATGCGIVTARKVVAAFAPAPKVGNDVDLNAEIPENAKPSAAQVSGFAESMGIDSSVLMMMFAGGAAGMGTDMDISGMIPIARVVEGYNPKVRNMFLMILGQFEGRLGVPLVVINDDGSLNKELTIEYIEGLEEGRDPAENNIYFDSAGIPFEVIRVGVDAQSIYDADPLDPTKALQKNGMGVGRINWHKVPLDVRQVAYYAATKTGELSATNDGHLTWLRDHMKPDAKRLVFHGQAPKAISEFNEAARTGSLPTLRVMLARGPRRREVMPRRRAGLGRDLTDA
jgi:hypothetical protein